MDRLLEDFNVEPKNPSEEARRRWRSTVSVVTNPMRFFGRVTDPAKRTEAVNQRRKIQVSPIKKVEQKHELPPANMQRNEKATYSTSGRNFCSWEYDVFISFRGETRMNFTDHLYKSLVGKGFRTFRDDDRLGKGKSIQEHLFDAIENSRFSIIIFSKDYAASEWCLDELAKIMECPSTTPLPVFYGVEADEVLDQTGSFQASFQGYETNVNTIQKVVKWRNAMKKAANTVGWEVGNRHETEVLGKIIEFLSLKLNASITSINDSMKLVGMSTRVEEVIKYLNSEDLCYLGISGMSGIGKTTLASLVYEKIHKQFDATTFLLNIRDASEKDGIISLQAKLLSKLLKEEQVSIDTKQQGMDLIQRRLGRIKVLIVLDDVSNLEQLEALAGRPYWFMPGSKVIITTNNKHVLNAHQVNKTYVVDPLNVEEASELFCRIAFGSPTPPQRFAEHTKKFVHYTKGHPLALKVLGSSLIGRDDIRLWDSRWSMVTVTLDEEVSTKLLVNFNELNKTEKEVFLRIACFFSGWEKDRVKDILSCSFEFDPIYSMEVLRDRNLVDISNGRLHVHDLYQQMAQNIVHNKCPSEPSGSNILWSLECVSHEFKDNTALPARPTPISLANNPSSLRPQERCRSTYVNPTEQMLMMSGSLFSIQQRFNDVKGNVFRCWSSRYGFNKMYFRNVKLGIEKERKYEPNSRWPISKNYKTHYNFKGNPYTISLLHSPIYSRATVETGDSEDLGFLSNSEKEVMSSKGQELSRVRRGSFMGKIV